jgi:acetyl-CoA carboxylase, biotin carboxylase subunit
LRGHAMECRIYAEDPENHFFPWPGQITLWRTPHGPGIRLDEGVYEGWTVPGEYDPLLAKLIAWGSDRGETIGRLQRALEELTIAGIRTNTVLFQRIIADADFQSGAIHTRWLDERLASLLPARAKDPDANMETPETNVAMIAAALWHASQTESTDEHPVRPISRWREDGRRDQISRTPDR